MTENLLLRLRLRSGLTQEELSDSSGISVRTIRNFERGAIRRPRRSSVEMLLDVLDPELKERLHTAAVDDLATPVGMATDWLKVLGPEPGVWRGGRPPRSSLLGRDAEIAELGRRLRDQQVVVVTGMGGAGKSRVALAAAEEAGRRLDEGVAVVGLGRVPREHETGPGEALRLAGEAVARVLGTRLAEGGPHRLVVVLDDTEHLPLTTARLVDRLLARLPRAHVLVTARRPPGLIGASLYEVAPLDGDTGVELLRSRAADACPELDLSGCGERLAALVGLLDGLPRLIEFAARRLRTVSLDLLLTDDRAPRLLGCDDPAAPEHQRSAGAGLRWSLDLLDASHERLLRRLARGPVAGGDVLAGLTDAADVGLLADLADACLLQVDRGERPERGGHYGYRPLRHVRALLADDPPAVTAP
ncbi:helix-turn-helix domain-containing protein [Streptomyces sp. NPDC048182]|uniref:helix-turn-helix domain-containing protein n=1 Tax=Streptomyces sp. NPDC048182 TaxID=3365507 RepID=UPI003723654F